MVETVSHILQHAALSPRQNAGDRIENTEGWLLKKSTRLRRWNNRYFRLVPKDTDHGRVAVLSWTRSDTGSRSPSPTRGDTTKKKNTIEIDHDTTIVWYVSTKDGRRKLRVTTHDDEDSIFLDCASDKSGSLLSMWHDSISMAIRAAIECKSVKDSMMVRCVNCGRRIPMDKIDQHSLTCKRKMSYDDDLLGSKEQEETKKKEGLIRRRSSCILSYTGIGDDTEGALRICVEILVCLVTERVNLEEKNVHLMVHEAEDAIKAVKKCPPIIGQNGEMDAARRDDFCDAALDVLSEADEGKKVDMDRSRVIRRGDNLSRALVETKILSDVRNGRRHIQPMQYAEDKHVSVPKEGDDGGGPVDWKVLDEYLLL